MRALEMSKEPGTTMTTNSINATAGRLTRLALRVAIAAALGLAAAAILAGQAAADQAILGYSLGTTTTQAGGHPDLTASFSLEDPGEPEIAKNIDVNLPTGVFGNPGAIERCTSTSFALNQCAAGAQAGLVTIFANYEGTPNYLLGTAPVYNLQPQGSDETARFGFTAPTVNVPIIIPITVRSASDYGVRMNIKGIPQSIPLNAVAFTVWGFPAALSHDPDRFHIGSPGAPPGCPGLEDTSCNPTPYPKAAIFVRPFINNPTVCTAQPLSVSLRVTTYQDPKNSSEAQAAYPATTGCEKERFDPILNVGLTTDETDAPSGLDLQLKADQFLERPPSPSELRSATVTLPAGLSVNPDAADGQTSCSDAQARFGSDEAGQCPDNSKIGTFDVRTPALEGPLVGSLYIGRPQPGNQYRIFMIADGFGVHAKFAASVLPDPKTGQLTFVVTDLPQVPFEEFNLHLFASDRGLIATPTRCGVYEVDSLFVPWNDRLAPQHSNPILGLSSGPNGNLCPGLTRPFNPRLGAGTSTPVAGDFSDFHLLLERDDGDQFLGDLNFTMPPGLTGSLRGISYCPETSIAAAAANLGLNEQVAPSCPASSQIGTTNVAAGPGSHPFHAVGKMYLAGPFKGAPLSLVAVTPALAGPYDYGVVVVRVAIHVDPLDAHVTAKSDTVPSIIGGIPIRMRSIQVNIDKPSFMINPTNCSPFTVDSQGIGDQGTITDFSSYFQAVNCESLPFKPSMTMRQVGGRKGTRRATNPGLQLDIRTRPGDANVRSVSVTLSSAFEIDQRHLGNICSEKELTEKQCAGRTPIGKATTTTPLLDQPLTGPVYAVSGSGGLPRLAFILNGQVDLVPRADTKTVNGGRLQTTAPVVPDAPIGHFALTVFGGKRGYLVNTRDICRNQPVTEVQFVGQNGKARTSNVKVKTACGKSGARHKRHQR
jgi:hypothetical protein